MGKSKRKNKKQRKAALIIASKVVSSARGKKEVVSKIKAKTNTKALPLKAVKKKTATPKTTVVRGKKEAVPLKISGKPLVKIIARP